MKIKIIILSLLFGFTGLVVVGNTPLTTKEKQLILDTKSFKSGNTSFKIIDDAGAVIWEDKVENTYSVKVYNLKNLEIGTYKVEISDASKVQTQSILVNAQSVLLIGTESIVYKPSINKKGNNIDVNILNLGENVTIEITDSQFNSLHKETEKGEPTMEKRFDIKNLPSGEYHVITTVGDKTYSTMISK